MAQSNVVGIANTQAVAPGESLPPIHIPLPAKAVDIAARARTGYAVLEDGRAISWGDSSCGSFGRGSDGFAPETGLTLGKNPSESNPVFVPALTHVKSIVAEDKVAFALPAQFEPVAVARMAFGEMENIPRRMAIRAPRPSRPLWSPICATSCNCPWGATTLQHSPPTGASSLWGPIIWEPKAALHAGNFQWMNPPKYRA